MEPHLIVELLMQYLDRQPENDKLRIRLYMALRQAILDRALAQGVKLPPTRVLAADLRLGRNTVVRAYEQLLVEGYLEGRVGDGTYVSDVVDAASKPAAPRRLIGTRREGLSRRGRTIVNSAASSVIQNGAFMPGVPDVEQFPFSLWRRLLGKYLHAGQSRLLHYTHLGYGPLKVALASYLRVTRMMVVDPKQIVIVNGSHQGLDLCAHARRSRRPGVGRRTGVLGRAQRAQRGGNGDQADPARCQGSGANGGRLGAVASTDFYLSLQPVPDRRCHVARPPPGAS